MPEYISGRERKLNVGIVSYSEEKAALSVVGNSNFTGIITATSFSKSGGTSSQFLKADGSVDSSTYLTSFTETDTLDSVTGRGNSTSNGLSVGVVTATSFVGDITGDVTGNADTSTTATNAQGLTGSPDITITNVTGVAATFSGNVTIGGTLSYQDVENIDSIGIITAQQGIQVLANGLDITGFSTFKTGVSVTGVVTATTFDGSLATSNLSGTVTNAQLAGSIANAKLANSSIAIGGVTLNLGDTDATPAFDLSDATDYPFTSLTGITTVISGDTTPTLGGNLDANSKDITGINNINVSGVATATTFDGSLSTNNLEGTITNSQLAGSIANGKLANSSIAIGGITFNLGDTDTTPAFDLSDATSYPYTSLTGVTTEVSADTTPQLGGNLDLNSKDITGTGNVNVTGIITATALAGFDYLQAPHGSTVNYSVTVASKTSAHRYNGTGSGNGYVINGVESPFLTLTPGRTYRFTLSSSDMSSHPFRFYLEADKTTAYTTNVTSTATYTEIVVTDETPIVLHYQCSAHEYMGNAVQTNSNKLNTPYQIDGLKGANITGVVTATSFVGDVTGDVTGNADTSTTATNVTVSANNSTDETVYPIFVDGATGSQGAESDTGLTYNPNSGTLTATTFSGSGSNLTGLTGASAATYGSAGATPVIVVDSDGRITGISTVATSGGGISNVVEDTTPQLGGNLDLNSKTINGTGNINITGVVTATTFDGSLATSNLSGTITNAQLAGSIANAKLANSSIAIGGVTLNLGDTDATPAFDLSDATDYPYASLTGVTTEVSGDTTPQLGGDLDLNSKNVTGTGSMNVTGIITATSFGGSAANMTNLTGASAATYGSTGSTPVIIVDANGRITGISTVTTTGSGGGIAQVADDTSPSLGGNLDLNSKFITGSGGVSVSGVVTATSFVGDITGDVTGNADTATTSTNFTVTANNTTDETVYPVFVDGATGTQGAETDTGLSYNPNSGTLTATTFSGSGSSLTGLTGASAATYGNTAATPVIVVDANGRITGISTAAISGGGGGSIGIRSDGTVIQSSASNLNFIGTGITMADDDSVTDITIPTVQRTPTRIVASGGQTAFTVASYNSNQIDVYLNGAKLDSTEFTETNSTTITLTTGASANDVFESIGFSNYTGVNVTSANSATNAANVTVADESSDTTCFPLFVTAATGDLPPRTDASALTYDASNGTLSATTFSGSLTGNVTGDVTGDVTGTATTATNVTVADESSDTTCFPLFVTTHPGDGSGDYPPKLDAGFTYNASAGILGATTFQGNLDLSGLLKEGVNITAGKLSANTNIDLANGMVHLFTTTESTTSTPNIRVDGSTSLDSSMSTGESTTVVIISAAAAAGYSAELTIDGSAVTESWLGGSAPSEGGSSGYDVYTYNIIKTGSATFVVLANLVNFA